MFKPWKVTAVLTAALLSTDAVALDRRLDQDIFEDGHSIYPGWYCEDCRNPAAYPEDFAAFAFNAYWGDDAWAFSSWLGIPFRVYNPDIQWVAVWFEDFLFDGVSLLPNTMDIRVRLPSGQVITITVVQDGPDMPLGEPEAPGASNRCDCGGGENDPAEIEDIDNAYEEPERPGRVEIVDPDANGEFPEWEREL